MFDHKIFVFFKMSLLRNKDIPSVNPIVNINTNYLWFSIPTGTYIDRGCC